MAGESTQVALGGRDGDRAEELLASSKRQGIEVLADVTGSAVGRLLRRGRHGVRHSERLYDDGELGTIAGQLHATMATADLLGRSRVRLRLGRAQRFSEPTDFAVFAELRPLTPKAALDYFKALVPTLAPDPKRYGPLMERQAFTMAEATGKRVLQRVQKIILGVLQKGDGFEQAPDKIDAVLQAAGVHPRNPGYSELVFRTNMMEAFRAGAQREFSDPDVADYFPVWRYLGIADGRERHGPPPLPDHRRWFNKFFDRSVPFVSVRGTDAANVIHCRCDLQPIYRDDWHALKGKGARLKWPGAAG